MRIVQYHPAHLTQLTRLVNAHVSTMPPYAAFTEERVDWVARHAHTLWDAHYEAELKQPNAPKRQLLTLCALDIGILHAAACLVLPGDKTQPAVITCVLADGVHAERALPPLLERIEIEARIAGYSEIQDGRFAFGGGWWGIWNTWGHVVMGLKASGFQIGARFGVFRAMNQPPPQPIKPAIQDYGTGWHMNKQAGEWTVRAFIGQKEIGECQSWVLSPAFEGHSVATEWATLEWCEVKPDFRRHGVARHIAAEQMAFQSRRGVRLMIAVIEDNNRPAEQLAQSLGFAKVGTCLSFMKRLV